MAGELPAVSGASASGGGQLSDITGAFSTAVNLFANQNATQNGTQVTSIDQEGMKYLLNQILGSTQGLAGVLNGGQSAGLYNSVTSSLLADDLLARMTGEVASRNTTTTSSAKTSKKAPFNSPILGTLAGGVMGGSVSVAKKLGKKLKKLF